MTGKWTALRGVVWFVAIYHLLAGLVLIGPISIIQWAGSDIGGMKMPTEAQFYYLARPFGTYLLAFGLMLALAAYDPVKNRAMISVAIALIGLRIIQRLQYMAAMDSLFGVSAARSLVVILLIAALGVCLAVLRFRVHMVIMRATPPVVR